MLTDPTETGDFHHPHEEGFTQAWDTVGAGANNPRQRELTREERKAPTVRLSVSYVGHNARDKNFYS
jgi:hypothetical protein